VTIHVPPLRDRKDDIPLLINSFLKKFSGENNKAIDDIDEKVRAKLYNYPWPGNIRELRNCIESAVVMARGNIITEDDLPPTLRNVRSGDWMQIPAGVSLAEAEKIIIRETLSAQNGNKSKTAKLLKIGRKTLHRKLDELGLEVL
jgi:DNA-binding NtrC family response regulator